MMALADAATAADAAKMMALADAATAADAAKMMALADAATLAGDDKAEALRLADEAHMTALADAKTAADAAQMTALADAKTAADAAQMTALADAKTAADAAQMTALADAKTAADAAQMTALADAKTAADAAQMTALADAKTAADAAQMTAVADAKTAANAGLVAALEGLKLEPASDTMSVEDQLAANTAILRDEIADIRDKARDVLAEADLKEKIARATEISSAIDLSPDGSTNITVPVVPGVTVDDNDPAGVTATRDTAGVVTVALTGADEDDFTGGEASAGTVWSSGTLMRTNDDKSEDTIVVYTDIAAPTPTNLRLQLTGGVVVIDVPMEQGRVVPTDLPTGDAALTFDLGDEFKGTYRGISGTFECVSTVCTVSLDTKKKPVVSGDILHFLPDSIGDTYGAPDAAYAYFGWWLNKPDKEDAGHTVEVFSGGVGNDFPLSDVADLEGKATYKGPAAGKYATKTITAGALSDAEAGHFTAAVSLTADFDADSTPDGTDQNDAFGNISGTVSDFELSGEVNSRAWKLTLGTAPLSTGSVTFVGRTDVDFGGGKETGIGDWQGTFYNDTDTGDDAMDDVPGTVAGTFSAKTGGASLLGAFGATKQ